MDKNKKTGFVFSLLMIFLIISSISVIALPTPTGVYGYIQNSGNPNVNINIFAYNTGTENLAHFRQTSARLNDGAYVEVLTTDYTPNIDILVVAISSDEKYHGTTKINNHNPGQPIQIDINMVESTPEVPPPDVKPPPAGEGGSGGGGGGGGAPPIKPPYDTDRDEMPPLDDGGDEDLGRYLEDYYRQLEDEYQRWRQEQEELERQRYLEKQEERQFNLLLEFALYAVLAAVIATGYFVYKQKKYKFIKDVLVKEYFSKRKKKKN
jgi:hypothetical protein